MLLNSVELGSHLSELRKHFLPTKKIAELGKPENFEHDLDARAYLVLAHSAFEQFFEDTARDFLASAVDRWLNGLISTRQQITTLCCLASTHGDLVKLLAIEAYHDEDIGTVKKQEKTLISPRIRFSEALNTGKKNFENILERNHGADLHYLQTIFPAIGVYVDPTPDAQSALSHIANARGTFAHRRTASKKGKFAYKPIAAEKAIQNVEALFTWCNDFEMQLRKSLRPDYRKIQENAKVELIVELIKNLKLVITRQSIKAVKART